jgi:probable rRNA maturation factor
MIAIQVSDSLPEAHLAQDPSVLERAAAEALLQAGAPASSALTVVITGDEQLHRLNRQFLGVDAPTDVLSFPSDEADPDTGERYLGDVLISLPRAAAQADARGHAVRDELQLLVVHGVLHLLGHDHAGPDEKARMWQLQASVLEMLDIHIKP